MLYRIDANLSVPMLKTRQLSLIPSTRAHLAVEIDAPHLLGDVLKLHVPPSWPPGEYDEQVARYFCNCMDSLGAAADGWFGWYAIREQDAELPRTLVGAAGYFGPPHEARVEIGYSIVPEWRCHGYASEIVQALIAHAVVRAGVREVQAHTAPDNTPSIAVLRRCGFVEDGVDESGLRFLYVHERQGE